MADLFYPYIFAYRWSVPARADARTYDPYVARATALLRARLVGLQVLRVERSELGIGDFKLVLPEGGYDVLVTYPGLGAAVETVPVLAGKNKRYRFIMGIHQQ